MKRYFGWRQFTGLNDAQTSQYGQLPPLPYVAPMTGSRL